MTELSDHLKVLADPTRLKILDFLLEPPQRCCAREDGVCGCDLKTLLSFSQPTVSHHMKQLVAAGFVRAKKRGRRVYYGLEPAGFLEVQIALEKYAAPTLPSIPVVL